MSVQAGLWFFDGRPVDRAFLRRVGDDVAAFGPDGCDERYLGSLGMIYRPFHTTEESKLENQPCTTAHGNAVMWDGRLDNRSDLIAAMNNGVSQQQTDVEIVGAAYDRWGTECFRRFIGDWALTVWDATERVLILARDYAAIRHLYYLATPEKFFWCSHLAPIVLHSGGRFTVNDNYVAGYMAMYPDANLTPYREINAVPPASFVKVRDKGLSVHTYWTFEPKNPIRYKTDAQYEEHYRYVLRQAVRRRLRSNLPVLADLSGGYDSSAIVCIADDIFANEGALAPRIDTVSLFDRKEPEMDDHLYFTKVEEKRGTKGFHLDAEVSGLLFTVGSTEFSPTPAGHLNDQVKTARHKLFQEGGYRVSLSGTGGDEMNGQATDFRVVMADSLAQLHLKKFASEIKAWSLLMRRSWMQMFFQVFVQLLPLSLRAVLTEHAQNDPWIDAKFSRRCHFRHRKLGQYEGSRFWLPSLRDWAATLATLARHMSTLPLSTDEKRYPYLDRDLFDFVSSIPPDQFLRPGDRRSLMRRALKDYLPKEVLTRKTKATAGRFVTTLVENQWHELQNICDQPLSAHFGYVTPIGFRNAIHDAKIGKQDKIVTFLRLLSLEYWLRDVARRGLISVPGNNAEQLKIDWAQSPI